ncbi:MAG: ATP-binding cassette domain-containing protein, partial [Patescibacteria group bacterium]
MIHIKNLSKHLGLRTLFDRINLDVAPGEFVVITGPSGSGKTTLLNLLLGEVLPTSGTVHVDGKNIHELNFDDLQKHRTEIGTVFQDYKLFPHKTVFENVAFPLHLHELPETEVNARVADLLHDVDLDNHHHHFPHELSGGEQARAAIARALTHEPKIILADEPTGNLDTDHAAAIVKLLLKENAKGKTVV